MRQECRKFLPDLGPENKSGEICFHFLLHVQEELLLKVIEFTLQCCKFHLGYRGRLTKLDQGLIALENHSIIRPEDRLKLRFRALAPIQDDPLNEIFDPERSGDEELFQGLLTLVMEVHIKDHLVDDAYRLPYK